MALGLEAAGGVDRQPAILLGPALGDGSRALAALGEAHGLVLEQLGDGEAVVGLDEAEVVERRAGGLQRLVPGLLATLEERDVALAHGQEVVDLLCRPEDHRLLTRKSAVSGKSV